MYLSKGQIQSLIESEEMVIRPLLDATTQLGEITLDLRLGTDFLVSFQGRGAYIDAANPKATPPLKNFFEPTRRRMGQTFLLHPNQTVLCSSLEYLKLPENVFAVLIMRSSYARLGLSLATIVQPGYAGCFSIELTNINNNPIQLRVGARLFQARFFQASETSSYFQGKRKYVCQVRPIVSRADMDEELNILQRIGIKS